MGEKEKQTLFGKFDELKLLQPAAKSQAIIKEWLKMK